MMFLSLMLVPAKLMAYMPYGNLARDTCFLWERDYNNSSPTSNATIYDGTNIEYGMQYVHDFLFSDVYTPSMFYYLPSNIHIKIKELCENDPKEKDCEILHLDELDDGFDSLNSHNINLPVRRAFDVWNDNALATPLLFGGYYEIEGDAYVPSKQNLCSFVSNLGYYQKPAIIVRPDLLGGGQVERVKCSNGESYLLVNLGLFSVYMTNVAYKRRRDHQMLHHPNFEHLSHRAWRYDVNIHEIGHILSLPDWYLVRDGWFNTYSIMNDLDGSIHLGQKDKICSVTTDASDFITRQGFTRVLYNQTYTIDGDTIVGYENRFESGPTNKGFSIGNPLVNMDDINNIYHEYYAYNQNASNSQKFYKYDPDSLTQSTLSQMTSLMHYDSPPILTSFYEYDFTQAWSLFTKNINPNDALYSSKLYSRNSYTQKYPKLYAQNIVNFSGYKSVEECLDEACEIKESVYSLHTPSITFDPFTSKDVIVVVDPRMYVDYDANGNEPSHIYIPPADYIERTFSGAIRVHPGRHSVGANSINLRKSYTSPTVNCINQNCAHRIMDPNDPIVGDLLEGEYREIGTTAQRPATVCTDWDTYYNCYLFWLDTRNHLGNISYITYRIAGDSVEFSDKIKHVWSVSRGGFGTPMFGVSGGLDAAYYKGDIYLVYKTDGFFHREGLSYMVSRDEESFLFPNYIPDIGVVEQPSWQAPIFFDDPLELHWVSVYQ